MFYSKFGKIKGYDFNITIKEVTERIIVDLPHHLAGHDVLASNRGLTKKKMYVCPNLGNIEINLGFIKYYIPWNLYTEIPKLGFRYVKQFKNQ